MVCLFWDLEHAGINVIFHDYCSVLFHQGISLATGRCKLYTLFQPTDLPTASAARKLELLEVQVYCLTPPEEQPTHTCGQRAYQVKNGCHNFVDSLNLLLLEAYHFHGISYCFELCTIIDGTLRGKRCLGHEGLNGSQL